MTVIERKYAMTKLGPGDYLLPSNDAQTIWRLSTYEDGPSYGLDDWPRDRTLWRVQRWTGPMDLVDVEDDAHWEGYEDFLERRVDAIQSALGAGGR